MRLFLIRHGQTEWNINGRAQGHTDIPLDPIGLHQAQLLGQRFEGEEIDLVLSSDLQRARMTADAVASATRAPLELLPSLRERGFGTWEGKHFIEFAAALSASHLGRFDFTPPDGESFRDVWARLEPVAQRLMKVSGNVVVVSHGGSLSLLLARLIGGPIEISQSFRFANTGVTELGRLPDGRVHLATYNDTRHLESIHELENPFVGSIDGSSR